MKIEAYFILPFCIFLFCLIVISDMITEKSTKLLDKIAKKYNYQ